MATEEISDMDTLLEEEVEDVGEVALEEEAAEEEEEEPAEEDEPVVARDEADAVGEGLLFRSLALLTTALLLFALPVAVGMSKGKPGALASFFADLFSGSK